MLRSIEGTWSLLWPTAFSHTQCGIHSGEAERSNKGRYFAERLWTHIGHQVDIARIHYDYLDYQVELAVRSLNVCMVA